MSENDLARQLDMSRSPVRDAITTLAQEGLVEQIPQVGVRVKEITNDDFREMFSVRESLEPLAAEQLAARFSTEAFERLSALVEEMIRYRDVENVPKFLESDAEFHVETARFACMPFIEGILRQIGDRIKIFGHISSPDRERMTRVIAEHRDILSAARSGDREGARKAALAHLADTKKRLENGNARITFQGS